MELDGKTVSSVDIAALALHNYGHFTSMRVEDLRVRGLAWHLERLVHDCRALFAVDLDADRVRALVRRVCRRVPSPSVVRVTVFAPGLDLGRPAAPVRPRVLVTSRPAPAPDLPPLRLATAGYRRDLPEVKHVGLFGSVYQRRAAQLRGFDDVLFVHPDGHITEGATWNVCFFDGRLVWPRSPCLPGVTMRLLNAALGVGAGPAEIEPTEAVLTADDVPGMRAAFVTNAAVGVRPVARVDEVVFAGEPAVLETLRRAYAGIALEEI
ncbi:aminotransferase [Planosporangium mesophilum]|nr:aminotransferase class IV [Planosporangium mesophilum]NJC82540.1 aminotransferase [Planosporangium mesophilum]